MDAYVVPNYRCFAASQEAQYPNVRKARWHNYDLLREVSADLPHEEAAEQMALLIDTSLSYYNGSRRFNGYDLPLNASTIAILSGAGLSLLPPRS